MQETLASIRVTRSLRISRFSRWTASAFLLSVGLMLVEGSGAIAQAPQRGVTPTRPATAEGQNGSYYALVIGINQYRQPLPTLKTAVNDAEAVSRVLDGRYGFRVKMLLNESATRSGILNSLSQYRRALRENDNLLIYYAGHGHSDPDAGKAYWLPADAEQDSTANWIIADELTTDIRVLPARHVLIISDSCYSGGLTREAEPNLRSDDRSLFLKKMLGSKSRTLMASGGNEPVADSGPGGHSVFAAAVLKALEQSSADAFTAGDLFHDFVQRQVAGRSDQIPRYSFIRNSDHDDGDFVFMRHGASASGGTVLSNAATEGSAARIEMQSTWEQLPSSPTDVLALVKHDNTIVVADRSGQVQRTTDNGAHWTAQALGGSVRIATLAACGALLFAGNSGYGGSAAAVFVSDDDGAVWRPTSLNGENVTALGCSGRTVLASLRRKPDAPPPAETPSYDRFSPAATMQRQMGRLSGKSDGMDPDAVLMSGDGGSTWTVSRAKFHAYKIAIASQRQEIWGLDLDSYGGNASILSYCLNTQTWTCSTVRSRFSGAAPATFQRMDGAIYVGTTVGSIIVSTDDGKTWNETRLPIENQGPRQYGPQKDGVRAMTVGARRVIAGTRAEGVWMLKDGGEGSTLVGGRPIAGLNCLYYDGTTLFAGTTDSIYRIRFTEPPR